VTNYFKC